MHDPIPSETWRSDAIRELQLAHRTQWRSDALPTALKKLWRPDATRGDRSSGRTAHGLRTTHAGHAWSSYGGSRRRKARNGSPCKTPEQQNPPPPDSISSGGRTADGMTSGGTRADATAGGATDGTVGRSQYSLGWRTDAQSQARLAL